MEHTPLWMGIKAALKAQGLGRAPRTCQTPLPVGALPGRTRGRWLAATAAWALAGAPGGVSAAELFVAPNGSDTAGTGSVQAPYASVSKAASVVNPGDVITLRGGAYAGGVIIRASGVTVRSYPGEAAVISAPTTDVNVPNCLWFTAAGGKVQNLEIIGGNYFGIKFDQGSGLVEGCKIHDTGYSCLKLVPGDADMVIRHCEIYRSGNHGQGIDSVRADQMLVQDCYIHDIPDYAAVSKGGAIGCVFERVRVENCDTGIVLGQSTDLQWFDTTANPDLYENIDGIVRNCIVVNTHFAGIGMWGALRPQVYNNTVLNAAQLGQAGVYFFYGEHWPGGVDTVRPCMDPTVINNIVVVSVSSKTPNVYLQPNSVHGKLTMSNNRYQRVGGAALFWDLNDYPNGAIFKGNLPEWQAHIFGETGSSDGDPDLDGSYRLLPGSPCIGAGLALPQVTSDFFGQPRIIPYDIGAARWLPAATVTTSAATHAASHLVSRQSSRLARLPAPKPAAQRAARSRIASLVRLRKKSKSTRHRTPHPAASDAPGH
jgi:hypothetical protein